MPAALCVRPQGCQHTNSGSDHRLHTHTCRIGSVCPYSHSRLCLFSVALVRCLWFHRTSSPMAERASTSAAAAGCVSSLKHTCPFVPGPPRAFVSLFSPTPNQVSLSNRSWSIYEGFSGVRMFVGRNPPLLLRPVPSLLAAPYPYRAIFVIITGSCPCASTP